mmetsp:Transcript_1179/g.1944  ORF Transcript_1179/g.1944 Transcript_1179/m.1944 type:complete len:226 (+) Transcript_1179:371-1048(+)
MKSPTWGLSTFEKAQAFRIRTSRALLLAPKAVPSGMGGSCCRTPSTLCLIFCTSFSNSACGTHSTAVSQMTTPKAKISDFTVRISPLSCSGGMYGGLPDMVEELYPSAVRILRAQPKSAMHALYPSLMRMFLVLRSLWRMFKECRYFSPVPTSASMPSLTCGGVLGPDLSCNRLYRFPRHNSKISPMSTVSCTPPNVAITPWNLQIDSCRTQDRTSNSSITPLKT